jgi:hypothetical protein
MSDLSRTAAASLLVATVAFVPMATSAEAQRFIPDIIISSTVPGNGDLNPYGVALVPPGFPSGGTIVSGDILISNFNNKRNRQGTGTTIVKFTPNDGVIAPQGQATTFFTSSAIGLTTALGVLNAGFVLVGNLPNSHGKLSPGSLQLIDRNGKLTRTITDKLDGPWDLTIVADHTDTATVFVSNVLNGTVTRLNLTNLTNLTASPNAVQVKAVVIASGYTVQPNAAALILGPTGLAYDAAADTLYVASTADNEIFAVSQAGARTNSSGTGTVIFQDEHLRGPLALAFAPNGDLVTSNGDAVNADPTQPSEIVEFTKSGKFIGQFDVDAGQGGAFGLAIALVGGDTARLATVDDNTNSIIVIDQSVVP